MIREIGCYICQYKAKDALTFMDHIVATGHCMSADVWEDIKTDPEARAAIQSLLIQAIEHPEEGEPVTDPEELERLRRLGVVPEITH